MNAVKLLITGDKHLKYYTQRNGGKGGPSAELIAQFIRAVVRQTKDRTLLQQTNRFRPFASHQFPEVKLAPAPLPSLYREFLACRRASQNRSTDFFPLCILSARAGNIVLEIGRAHV